MSNAFFFDSTTPLVIEVHLDPVIVKPGTPASSTTQTGRHDVAEILLKVALNTIKNQIKIKILNKR
jgi:hypothetical protein